MLQGLVPVSGFPWHGTELSMRLFQSCAACEALALAGGLVAQTKWGRAAACVVCLQIAALMLLLVLSPCKG